MTGTDKRYFAAANTGKGFVSYYDEIFGKCKRIDIIKGGSGTGKSRLMNDIAKHALKKGHSVELFYCSFDPSSIDGIIIDGERAVIDGTAPHIYEPTLPGARDNIIDLGRFWNSDTLCANVDEISNLMREKKHCFDLAYEYLAAAIKVKGTSQKICEKFINRDKIKSECARAFTSFNTSKVEKASLRIMSAFGRSGLVRFDSYERMAEQTYSVSDRYGSGMAGIYIEGFLDEAKRFSSLELVSYDPLGYKQADAVLLGGNTKICISEENGDIDISEFMSGEIRNEKERLSENTHIFQILLDKAAECLCDASKVHFEIEKIYISAMDFEKKEKYSEELLNSMRL